MTGATRDPASFRDPGGHVSEREGCLCLTVSPERSPEPDATVSRIASLAARRARPRASRSETVPSTGRTLAWYDRS